MMELSRIPSRVRVLTPRPSGLLAGMRIRKKLIVLHTCFSLVLAAILATALRPAISEVIRQAESHEAGLVLAVALSEQSDPPQRATAALTRELGANVQVRVGTAEEIGIDKTLAESIRQNGRPGVVREGGGGWLGSGAAPVLAAYEPKGGKFITASVVLQGARDAVVRLYVLFTIALLAVYALVAAALELFVLPKAVYQPIQTMLDADASLQSGDRMREIIPEEEIPGDELGAIMASRNESVLALRRHEADLADALRRLEAVATDLTRKNHLLEMARQNLADADRLASLGMMSAGIAHELNTPLAVLKGLVERLNAPASVAADGQARLATEQAALMLRVVGRLERLSESLLDFARVRPPSSQDVLVRPLVEEAWTLVRLDRDAGRADFVNDVPGDLLAYCDGDRIVQVLVNILRNAVDVARSEAGGRGGDEAARVRIEVHGEAYERDGALWASLTITDTGPGFAPEMLGRLFQPFVSTRLDSKGTGLGLAVAEGIVREHGGVILARNRTDQSGAVFEIVLPRQPGIAHLPANQLDDRVRGDESVNSGRVALGDA